MSSVLSGVGRDAPARPWRTVRARSGWRSIDFRELWQFRDLTLTLAGRDLKLRYRQTAIGALWVVLQPLLAAGIFSFVFGRVARMPSDGVPYFVFSYAGLLGWNVFSGAVTKTSSSLVQNANLVSKVYFPRLILPLSMVFSTLIDCGVAMLLMPILMVSAHVAPSMALLTLPLWFVLLLMFAMGIGMVLSALAVSYRDVQYVVPVFMQLLLYACPVAYSVSKVPAALLPLYFLNPLADLIAGFRWAILDHGQPMWPQTAYAGVVCVVVFVAGAYWFRGMERRFADVI